MVIVDGGTCKGEFMKQYLYNGATIHAFEPFPINHNGLKKEFGDNPDFKLNFAALGGTAGKTSLYWNGHEDFYGYVGSSLCEDNRVISAGHRHDCTVVKLSEYYKEHINEYVNILKLDIEGSEYDVLDDLLQNDLINEFGTIYVEGHESIINSIGQQSVDVMKRVKEKYRGLLYVWDWPGAKWSLWRR